MAIMKPETARSRLPGADAAVIILSDLITAAEAARETRIAAANAATRAFDRNRDGFSYTALAQCQAALTRAEADLRVLRKQRGHALARYNWLVKACATP